MTGVDVIIMPDSTRIFLGNIVTYSINSTAIQFLVTNSTQTFYSYDPGALATTQKVIQALDILCSNGFQQSNGPINRIGIVGLLSAQFSLSASTGTSLGGTSITATGVGTNFLTGATVKMNGTLCTSVSVGSTTAITFNTAAGQPNGVSDVLIQNPDGNAYRLLNAFTWGT